MSQEHVRAPGGSDLAGCTALVRKAGSRIEQIDQIRALASAVRQEILDTVQANGPSAIGEIAVELGRAPETLYYHVGRLTSVGLLIEVGTRATSGRPEKLYGVADGALLVRYQPDDERNVEAVGDMARAMLRVAKSDFLEGFVSGVAVPSGPRRNLWVGRTKGWVRPGDLEEINHLLNRILDLLLSGNSAEGGSLVALTWILAPIKGRSTRTSGGA